MEMPKRNRFVTGEIEDFRDRMLADPELKRFWNMKFGPDYVEVICGSVRTEFGEVVGRLRVSFTGEFTVIDCDCGCKEPTLAPVKFDFHWHPLEEHDWKRNIWVVMDNGYKPRLYESALFKYYRYASNEANWESYPHLHRDEFVRCSNCQKNRRFVRRRRSARLLYHMATLKENWTCADWRNARHKDQRITCDDEEEDAAAVAARGCREDPNCQGCNICVCGGCEQCHFLECDCSACVDFMYYKEPQCLPDLDHHA